MKSRILFSILRSTLANSLMTLSFVLLVPATLSQTLYWDVNGDTPGSGGPSPDGTWSASGNTNWTSDSSGSIATTDWVAGTNATFTADADATSPYTVTVSGTVDVGSIVEQSSGILTLSGGLLNFTQDGITNFYVTIQHATVCNSQITGNITNLTVSGGGTSRRLELNNSANNWAGNLTIGSGLTVTLHNSDEVIPDWAVVNLAPGRLRLSTGTAGTGRTETIAGLTGNGGVSMDGGNLILNVTNTSVTYIWNGRGANSAPAGSGTITKRGAGTQIFGHTAGNYGGGTTNLEGMLGAGVDNAFGTGPIYLLGGGIFNPSAASRQLNNPVVLESDTVLGATATGDLTSYGDWMLTNATWSLTVNNTNTTIFGTISDPTASGGQPLGLIKAGPGTLALGGFNTYLGDTVVSGGTLLVNGAVATNVMVMDGATLGGIGTIAGSVAVAGTLAPGASVGTLTINGNLDLTNQALFEIDESFFPANDFVAVAGTLTVGGTLTVTNAGASGLTAGQTFTLFNQPAPGFTKVNLPVGYYWTNELATLGSITVGPPTFPTIPTNITVSVSGGNLTLTWPANYAGGWVLESSVDLTNWMTVPGSRDVSSITFPVNIATPEEFYRLHLL